MAIARVQSKTANNGSTAGTTLTITLTGNGTVGNTLFVGFVGAGGIPSRFKYGSNTEVPFAEFVANNVFAAYAVVPIQEASTSIVITMGSQLAAAVAVEYSGRLITCDLPPLSASNSSGTSNTSGTTATSNYANELAVSIASARFATATEQTAWLTSTTNSFTSVAQTSSSANTTSDREIAFLEKIVTSTGTFQTTGTQPANSGWVNLIATFTDNPLVTPGGGLRAAGHGGLAA